VLASDDWRECEGRKTTDRFWLDGLGLEKSMPEKRRSNGSSEPRLRERRVDCREESTGEDAKLSCHRQQDAEARTASFTCMDTSTSGDANPF
jgi:hypothetical protein